MQRPPATTGLRHVALWVANFAECEHFYTAVLGMQVEWRPDPDNVYLTSGNDNLALHRAIKPLGKASDGRLDHIGFILGNIDDVDLWYQFMQAQQVSLKTAPKTHRDGARSFYCADPDTNIVQIIYHPPLAK
jgi:catechol 2,3-dioxygenase-like lactoylglutathione lyase family enzyme